MPIDTAQRPIIDPEAIEAAIATARAPEAGHVRDILAKALMLKGLSHQDVATLSNVDDPDLLHEMYDTARRVKEAIYGNRLVVFAPLYVANLCCNECVYCAFRVSNRSLRRRALGHEEIGEETRRLIRQGHKRVLLVSGEQYPQEGFDYILDAIDTIYATKEGGEIRRINVNVAPLETEEFVRLKARGIGTYQLFQETYHRPTYEQVHLAGRKRDYDWRLTALDRAMEAGIDDVGMGVLFGLYDWRFETLALMQHIAHLEDTFGVGCHTISVPRIEPAAGSDLADHPPHAMDDTSFKKLVAILRLAVPYTGLIMSTRETPAMRRATFALGVSQISAGSRTNPGGYGDGDSEDDADGSQFQLGDHRPLDEVIRDVSQLGYIPSFCTACYRLGRTGADFMDLAKPGLIKDHCDVNALSTFQEYLGDYASPETRAAGEKLIHDLLERMPAPRRKVAQALIERVRGGDRDVFV